MLFADGSIEGRWNGETHRLSIDGVVEYASPAFSARLEPGSLELLDASGAHQLPAIVSVACPEKLALGVRGMHQQDIDVAATAELQGLSGADGEHLDAMGRMGRLEVRHEFVEQSAVIQRSGRSDPKGTTLGLRGAADSQNRDRYRDRGDRGPSQP